MLQQREVLLVALLATLKCPPAGMTPDARLQQQVMLAALQTLTFIAPSLEATPDAYTVPKVSFVLALGFVWSWEGCHGLLCALNALVCFLLIPNRMQQNREFQIVGTSAHA